MFMCDVLQERDA
jgi:Trichohyalin-plectin-homology domain